MKTAKTPPTPAALKAELRERALALGFDQIGFAAPEAGVPAGDRLMTFLDHRYHGDMTWLVEKAERRRDPQALWPEVRSVVMLAMNYGPEADPLPRLAARETGVISVYAQNRDYHDLIKKRLKTLARWLHEVTGAGVKVFVDTAPVMEKPLAQAAGLGWQGKHTNLVSRERGSWVFLGSIFTTYELPLDTPDQDHCGRCHRCLDACPTEAFVGPYQLDARRCISYLTIEHKGHIDREFRAAMGNRIYGCDDCLAVCPWNKFAATARETAFHPREDLKAPLLRELVTLDDAAFRTFFTASPVKRLGRDRFVRNVLIAIGNSGDESFVPLLAEKLADPSPLVRAMAVWALGRLAPPAEFTTLRARHLATEPDPAVQSEWRDAA